MGRPCNSPNVTEGERERIRELYRQGVRVADIARRVRRGESVVYRTVRGLSRSRPWPRRSARIARRNRLILQRVVEEELPQVVVARRFRLTPTMVCQIVREALGLRPKRGATCGGPTRKGRKKRVRRR